MMVNITLVHKLLVPVPIPYICVVPVIATQDFLPRTQFTCHPIYVAQVTLYDGMPSF